MIKNTLKAMALLSLLLVPSVSLAGHEHGDQKQIEIPTVNKSILCPPKEVIDNIIDNNDLEQFAVAIDSGNDKAAYTLYRNTNEGLLMVEVSVFVKGNLRNCILMMGSDLDMVE